VSLFENETLIKGAHQAIIFAIYLYYITIYLIIYNYTIYIKSGESREK